MNGGKGEKCRVINWDKERNKDNIKQDRQYTYYVTLRRGLATAVFFSVEKAVSINMF